MIVGVGLAGTKPAEALRDQGFTGRLVVFGAEPHGPYEPPPLSKGFLKGKTPHEDVFVHPQAWYPDHEVELNLGQAVTSIDHTTRRAELAGRHRGRLRPAAADPRSQLACTTCGPSMTPRSCATPWVKYRGWS